MPRRAAVASAMVVGIAVAACAVAPTSNPAVAMRGSGEAPARPGAGAACPEGMAGIPGGSFMLGSFTVGETQYAVKVGGYCLDVTEVTVSAFTRCVQAGACSEPKAYLVSEDSKIDRACNWRRPGADLHPVNCVDWSQAVSFCGWAQKRLPSEEEWEWAARGGDRGTTYPWGNEEPSVDRLNACGTECVAWSDLWGQHELRAYYKAMYVGDDGWPATAPVGSFPKGANRSGVQDLAGNVWEWTSSRFGIHTEVEVRARVIRGGSWTSSGPSSVSASFRTMARPEERRASVGFRCARNIP
jgi:formylglycine-generating enzyme required for sulfatase activity